MDRILLCCVVYGLAFSPAYAAQIRSVTVTAVSDHPMGSSFGDSNTVTFSSNPITRVTASAATTTPTASASARASAYVQVFPDSSGLLTMFSHLQTSDSYQFSNSAAGAQVSIDVQLDGRRQGYTGIAAGDGFLNFDDSAQSILRAGQNSLINRFVGGWNKSYAFAGIWHLIGTERPGSAPNKPLGGNSTNPPPVPVPDAKPILLGDPDDPGDDNLATEPQDISGAFLVDPSIFIAPIVDQFGVDNPIYFDASSDVTDEPVVAASVFNTAAASDEATLSEASSASSMSSDYVFFASADNPDFLSFVLPDLDPSIHYTVFFAGATLRVAGGQAVDFSAVAPNGVSAFLVRGLTGNTAAEFPHVFGLTFNGTGVAHFASARVVPELGSVSMLLVSTTLLVWRSATQRRKEAPRYVVSH